MIIETERPEHVDAIRALLAAAYPTDAEACLVDELRAVGALSASLVAMKDGVMLGYVGFSPVEIRPAGSAAVVWGLAPLAVSPDVQRQGVGSALIRAGLRACADAGCRAVVVLGNPGLYGRFGFRAAAQYGLRCIFDAPPEAFMIADLGGAGIPFHEGVVHFHTAFDRFAA